MDSIVNLPETNKAIGWDAERSSVVLADGLSEWFAERETPQIERRFIEKTTGTQPPYWCFTLTFKKSEHALAFFNEWTK